jgi:hypothetical protein
MRAAIHRAQSMTIVGADLPLRAANPARFEACARHPAQRGCALGITTEQTAAFSSEFARQTHSPL